MRNPPTQLSLIQVTSIGTPRNGQDPDLSTSEDLVDKFVPWDALSLPRAEESNIARIEHTVPEIGH